MSPHHLGLPQWRERFYAVARRRPLREDVLPEPKRANQTALRPYLTPNGRLTKDERHETRLSDAQVACIELWNEILRALPATSGLPSFPIWSDEFGAIYPFERKTPFGSSKSELLVATKRLGGGPDMTKAQIMALLPSYARKEERRFPYWKTKFITQNRSWYQTNRRDHSIEWFKCLRQL